MVLAKCKITNNLGTIKEKSQKKFTPQISIRNKTAKRQTTEMHNAQPLFTRQLQGESESADRELSITGRIVRLRAEQTGLGRFLRFPSE